MPPTNHYLVAGTQNGINGWWVTTRAGVASQFFTDLPTANNEIGTLYQAQVNPPITYPT